MDKTALFIQVIAWGIVTLVFVVGWVVVLIKDFVTWLRRKKGKK